MLEPAGPLTTEPPAVIPILERFLTNANCVWRGDAAWALGQYGTLATSTVPSLLTALNDTNARVGMFAGNALREIAPGALTNASPG